MAPSIHVRRHRPGRTLSGRRFRPSVGGSMTRRRAAVPVLCLAVLTLAAIATAQALVSPELRADAARLFQELADIRGLPPPGTPPPLVIQSREERRRFVVAELSRRYSPARLDAERRALVAWGLVPSDF
ncbi:MAG TPA: hypothetical protein VFF12_06310, partial [Myxococcaceae bacterium]|nr:hypothetical protein [Myxococcaceae bacterium]